MEHEMDLYHSYLLWSIAKKSEIVVTFLDSYVEQFLISSVINFCEKQQQQQQQ